MFGNAKRIESSPAARRSHAFRAGNVDFAHEDLQVRKKAVINQRGTLKGSHGIDPCGNMAGLGGDQFRQRQRDFRTGLAGAEDNQPTAALGTSSNGSGHYIRIRFHRTVVLGFDKMAG